MRSAAKRSAASIAGVPRFAKFTGHCDAAIPEKWRTPPKTGLQQNDAFVLPSLLGANVAKSRTWSPKAERIVKKRSTPGLTKPLHQAAMPRDSTPRLALASGRHGPECAPTYGWSTKLPQDGFSFFQDFLIPVRRGRDVSTVEVRRELACKATTLLWRRPGRIRKR